MKRSPLLLILALGALIPAAAQSPHSRGQDKDKDHAAGRQNSAAPHGAKQSRDPRVFSHRDRNAIRDHYRADRSGLPPGLAKRNGNLPPGLRKQLQRNGTLPPGLQQRIQPLSRDIERRLRPLDYGYSRGILGQDVVIVEDRTQRIIDIIRDVAARR